jgi:L-amino acid N-acyltransferase YncA
MKTSFNIEIRPAEEGDISGILSIQNSFLLSNNDETLENRGFLVYPITQGGLKEVILNKNDLLLVALNEKEIIGYALLYGLDEWKKFKPSWNRQILIDNQIKEVLSKNKTLYFRHIARKEGYPSLGKQLEEKAYVLARNTGYKFVIGEILEKPYSNKISKKVHEARGYKRIGEVKYPDGKLWGIYKKDLV